MPSKGYFPTNYPDDMSETHDAWYRDFYDTNPKTWPQTNYYGTWFHIEEYRNGGGAARSSASRACRRIMPCSLSSSMGAAPCIFPLFTPFVITQRYPVLIARLVDKPTPAGYMVCERKHMCMCMCMHMCMNMCM